jgi:hypothetical protein
MAFAGMLSIPVFWIGRELYPLANGAARSSESLDTGQG